MHAVFPDTCCNSREALCASRLTYFAILFSPVPTTCYKRMCVPASHFYACLVHLSEYHSYLLLPHLLLCLVQIKFVIIASLRSLFTALHCRPRTSLSRLTALEDTNHRLAETPPPPSVSLPHAIPTESWILLNCEGIRLKALSISRVPHSYHLTKC